MGVCFSAIRVTGASSSRQNNNNKAHKGCKKPPENKPSTNTKRRATGSVPCGKRTDFGYAKDFHEQYTIGKLLGHGQFGYTYVAIDKSNGDRVAVKRLDKSKVIIIIRDSTQSYLNRFDFISTIIYYSVDSIFDSPMKSLGIYFLILIIGTAQFQFQINSLL